MNNTRNKKTILLASMGVLTLSTMAVVLLEQTNANFISSRAVAKSGRVVTVNKDNRILNYYDDGSQNYGGAIFLMEEKLGYGFVKTLQRQEDVYKNDNNCIFCLWGDWNAGYGCAFYINDDRFYDDDVISLDKQQLNVVDVVPFRHLTGIDFTLEKGEDRLTTLKGNYPDHTTGTMTKIEDTNNYVKYHWTPEGGFLGSDTDVYFDPTEPFGTEHKALWVTEMVFYYDC